MVKSICLFDNAVSPSMAQKTMPDTSLMSGIDWLDLEAKKLDFGLRECISRLAGTFQRVDETESGDTLCAGYIHTRIAEQDSKPSCLQADNAHLAVDFSAVRADNSAEVINLRARIVELESQLFSALSLQGNDAQLTPDLAVVFPKIEQLTSSLQEDDARSAVESVASVPTKVDMNQNTQGGGIPWTGSFTPEDDDNQIVQALFQSIDKDSDGKLSHDEVKKAFILLVEQAQADKSFVQLVQALDNLLSSDMGHGEISFIKFKEIAESVPRIKGQRLLLIRTWDLPGRLARLLKEGEIFDQLSGLRKMSLEQLDEVIKHFAEEVGGVLKAEWQKLNDPVEAAALTNEVELANSKFGGDAAIFGDTGMYQEGLENQIGRPDPLILKGLFRDNISNYDSDERAVTSNYKIVFSLKQEYARLFGNPKEIEGAERIPKFLTDVARGKHPNVNGPSEKELIELESEFKELAYYHDCVLRYCEVFPGDIGYIQKSKDFRVEADSMEQAKIYMREISHEAKKYEINPGVFIEVEKMPTLIQASGCSREDDGCVLALEAVEFKVSVLAPLSFFASKVGGTLGPERLGWSMYQPCNPSLLDKLLFAPGQQSSQRSFIYYDSDSEHKEEELRKVLGRYELSDLLEVLSDSSTEPRSSKEQCINLIVQEALAPKETNSKSFEITLMPGRKNLLLRELMEVDAVREAGLRVEEAVQAYQYTGPLFQAWNGILRKMPFNETSAAKRMGRGSPPPKTLPSTSLLVLVSAVLKMSRTSKIPSGRRVFRGFGRKLGSEWFKADKRGVICGVELGFMSTTTNREIALQYSGAMHGDIGTVLEFEVGAVDCGARLDTLSQYPGEGELLFPPLSNLEVVDRITIERFQGKDVLVVRFKVNINQKSCTIEEILGQRKQTIISIGNSLMKEVQFDLQLVSSKPFPTEWFEQEILRSFTMEDSTWFNDDKNFKTALNGILNVKEQVIMDFIPRELKGENAKSRFNKLQEVARRGKVEIVKALVSIGAKCNADTLSMVAEYLVKTGQKESDLLIAAVRDGRADVVRVLMETGTCVDEFDMVLAAENGHLEVVEALLENGKSPNCTRCCWGSCDYDYGQENSSTPVLYVAAMNGHVMVVKLLLEKGADVNSYYRKYHLYWDQTESTDLIQSAVDAARSRGHKEVVEVLLEKGAR